MDRITAAQVFVDVSHSGSFTATAQRLEMSRSMVTRHIEAMEQWLGVRLFHRTTRKVTLTTRGEQCLKDIEPWLTTAEQFESNLKATNQLSGSIKIASSMSFGHTQLVAAICQFMRLHPQIAVDIDLGDSPIDLVEHRIDLAIRIASAPDDALIGKPIALCRSVLVASPAYVRDTPTINCPEDLMAHQCLGYANFERSIWHLTRDNQRQSIEINGNLTANEATTLFEATKAGAGISMQPTYMVANAIRNGQLVNILPDWTPKSMDIYALYSSRKFLSPTVRALIDFLESYFQAHPWD